MIGLNLTIYRSMFDTRLKILSVIILSIALSISKPIHVFVIIAITLLLAIIYRKYLLKSITILLSTLSFILMIGIISWFLSSEINPSEIFLGSIKWVSLILMTFLIFSSINLFELISALVYFKLNSKIAIAFGVGLRFLPLILEEGGKILTVQKRKGALKNRNVFSKLNHLLSPFVISVVRRVDSITLSITTQQIEKRVKQFEFNRINLNDYLFICGCISFLIYVIIV